MTQFTLLKDLRFFCRKAASFNRRLHSSHRPALSSVHESAREEITSRSERGRCGEYQDAVCHPLRPFILKFNRS